MHVRVLDRLACPICAGPFRLEGEAAEGVCEQGVLRCGAGHRFPVRRGVPCLRPADRLEAGASDDPSGAISESFSSEWEHFDYAGGRTWHETLESRRQLFLREVGLSEEELAGQVVLDAGCGNGTLSEGMALFGCEVLAVDVSESVFRAQAHFGAKGTGRTHFIRGEIERLPVPDGSADVVYSSGVLHHNPSTRRAFAAIRRKAKPGGRIYIWVYHPEPGLKFRLQLLLRNTLAPLPMPAKKAFLYAWSSQSMLRQHLRTLLGTNDAADRLSWRERAVDLMDFYTPRYRWMHTQEEVHRWYAEEGLVDVATTEVRDWGFGVLGRAPLQPA